MANKHAGLDDLFTDIADAIRELTGDEGTIPAVEFPDLIRGRLELIPSSPSSPSSAYLTFSSPSSFTLKTSNGAQNWNGTLEYSTNTSTWETWDGTTELHSYISGSDNVLYLRGTNNQIIAGQDYNKGWVLTGSDIACSGNIETLLDYATVASGEHPTMADFCYCWMFFRCTSLTTAPTLPATTLARYCYSAMFYGCTNLTQVQAELPSKALEERCYFGMFSNCTNLMQAPTLPATILAERCYEQMFYGCTSLTQTPILKATTLGEACYQDMFKGCTSITTAPALPATALSDACYQGMFQNCTNLTTIPDLPATTLISNCYYDMFNGCTKIRLSTTQTGEYTKAYSIPKSGNGTTASYALYGMFKNTGGTFKSTPTINTTYYLSNTNTIVPAN